MKNQTNQTKRVALDARVSTLDKARIRKPNWASYGTMLKGVILKSWMSL